VTTKVLKEKWYLRIVLKRALRLATCANFRANSASISKDLRKNLLLGQPYRLIKATIAVAQNVALQVCQVLPEGSVVIVVSSSETGQKINVRCENQ
jgi:hypothetical protein